MKKKWFCTDNESLQYCKELGGRRYHFIEKVQFDTVEGDPGYPNKNYTVKTAVVDLNDYDQKEQENAICGYYDSLDALYTEYEDASDQIVAECIFEEMTDGSATTYGMMTEKDADAFIRIYVDDE